MTASVGPARWHGGLLYALLATASVAAVFYGRQNFGGQVGGPISLEKMLWLNYTVTAWFVVPGFLVRHPALDPRLRGILGIFLASMITRGAAELWLIYVAFGWSPLYGITHDVLTIGLVAILRLTLRGHPSGSDSFNTAVRRYCTSIQLALVAEIAFAALFYRMHVHQDAVYFAPPTAAFAHINLLTRWVDAAVYADLGLFLWRQRRALFTRPTEIRGALAT